MKIAQIHAREILDSRGLPTLEADVVLDNGILGRAAVPSGASTGAHEACELRDGDKTRYGGKGVLQAVKNVNTEISAALLGQDVSNQRAIDAMMIELDGTPNKSRLGANAILGVSLAVAYANANLNSQALFQSISQDNRNLMPVPLMNIINGGAHAVNNIDFQEFMIVPVGASSFSQALQWGSEVYQVLKSQLTGMSLSTGLGDEGGFAPQIDSPNEVLEILSQAITSAGLKPGTDIAFALDVASSEFYVDGKYRMEGLGKTYSSADMVDYLEALSNEFPIISIEDGLDEDDWDGWELMTSRLGNKLQLVGDDLFVTNSQRLATGIDRKIANSILIKLNQIGTLTETLDVMKLAKDNNYSCVVSHRSGETHDTTIADLAVATSCGQIKTGAPARTDRVSKYNQLLRIEALLGSSALYTGTNAFTK
ncbi:MAG TPA: phosphopyruvate hydratase [Acidimicrobiia bacterium]|nr:phosphopyruvate hydratase [Acidimicrobiia bacterium]